MLYNQTFWRNYNTERLTLVSSEFSQVIKGGESYSFSDPESFVKKYLEAVGKDFYNFLNLYKIFSPFQDSNIKSDLPFNYNLIPSVQFEAYVELSEDLNLCEINLSLGLLFSIQDLMNRLCCNKGILSESAEPPRTVWSGTTCFYPQFITRPKIRFSDYEPENNPDYSVISGNEAGTPIGNFYSGLPIYDKERLYTAGLMEFISLTWILFHEEAHYWHGHLHFISESNNNVISETKNTIIGDEDNLFKTFEWQADRNAIVDLMNLFFSVQPDNPFELPEYLKGQSDLSWFLRLIISSIGSTILIFQKRLLINDTNSYYPTPQTRMCTVIGIVYSRLNAIFNQQGHIFNISDWNRISFAIMDGLISGLNDLLIIEDVFVNNVDYENNLQRVFYEKSNPKSLLFLEDFDNISKIINGLINNLTSDDLAIENLWFSEYKKLIANHDYIFKYILPKYRAMAAQGKTPYD